MGLFVHQWLQVQGVNGVLLVENCDGKYAAREG